MIHGLNFRLSIYKNAPASGGLHPSGPLPALCPWTPLGNFHPPDPFLAPPQFNFLDLALCPMLQSTRPIHKSSADQFRCVRLFHLHLYHFYTLLLHSLRPCLKHLFYISITLLCADTYWTFFKALSGFLFSFIVLFHLFVILYGRVNWLTAFECTLCILCCVISYMSVCL